MEKGAMEAGSGESWHFYVERKAGRFCGLASEGGRWAKGRQGCRKWGERVRSPSAWRVGWKGKWS
eukprot:scaffold73094_cov34-Tisochrysis_lutea.AAC.1